MNDEEYKEWQKQPFYNPVAREKDKNKIRAQIAKLLSDQNDIFRDTWLLEIESELVKDLAQRMDIPPPKIVKELKYAKDEVLTELVPRTRQLIMFGMDNDEELADELKIPKSCVNVIRTKLKAEKFTGITPIDNQKTFEERVLPELAKNINKLIEIRESLNLKDKEDIQYYKPIMQELRMSIDHFLQLQKELGLMLSKEERDFGKVIYIFAQKLKESKEKMCDTDKCIMDEVILFVRDILFDLETRK